MKKLLLSTAAAAAIIIMITGCSCHVAGDAGFKCDPTESKKSIDSRMKNV